MAKSVLEIVFRTLRAGTGDRETRDELKNLEKAFKQTMAVAGAFSGVALAVGAALKFSVNEAMEAEKVQAKLAAVLKSTGNAAGLSQTQLNNLADSMSKMSGIDDELITNSQAVMLTFTSIGRQVFPDAMQAALDMNAVLGGDLQQSVIQLGKALNVTSGDTQTASMGLTAMRRSGVSFTEEQKQMALQMVKTGDVMGYQKLILKELGREFGGAAAAMGDTASGSADKLKVSLGNLGAAIGNNLIPAITRTNNALSETVDKITEDVEYTAQYNAAQREVAAQLGLTDVQLHELSLQIVDTGVDLHSLTKHQMYLNAQTEFFNQVTQQNTQELAANEEQLQASSDANKGMLDLIFRLQDENTKYNDKLDEVNAKFEDARYVQDLYRQSKSELLDQARAGTITWDEYSSKVRDLSISYQDGTFAVDSQRDAVAELAAAHEEASVKIAFSLLQQKAAVGGLTDAEFNALLTIGENWGILDETTADAAASMNEAMQALADGMDGPQGAITNMNLKFKVFQDMPDRITKTIIINVEGSIPNLYNLSKNAAGGGGGAYDPYAGEFAEGGQWKGGWAFVGERGYEMITPTGSIIPHEEAKKLVAMGIFPDKGYYWGNNVSTTNYIPGYYGDAVNNYKKKHPSSPNLSPDVVKSEVSQASSSAVQEMVSVTADAVQSSASVQQAQAMQVLAITTAIQAGNSEMVAEQRTTNRLLKNQPQDLAVAVAQNNP